MDEEKFGMNEVHKELAQLAGIREVLGADESRAGRRTRPVPIWIAAIALVVLAVIGFSFLHGGPKVQYVTQNARRGDLTLTVTATGTMRPTNEVEIGSELPGTIRSVEVNFNDEVHAGQVLARLDTSRMEAQVRQSKAAVVSAKASLQQAQAAAHDAESQVARLREVHKLSAGKVPSRQEMTNAETALERARAAVVSARASVEEAGATLETQQSELGKGEIRSPMNGIVLTRAAEPGQTVGASLQSHALFTIAEDLSHMQLMVDVDEADVGQVQPGQDVTFTVDAWPDREFPAKVTQVRYGAKSQQGVVTYETVLDFDNSEHLLRPGMTATAQIVVGKVTNSLLVPNAALRYEPPAQEAPKSGGLLKSLLSKRHAKAPVPDPRTQTPGAKSHVWTLVNGRPARVDVELGRSDGTWTEVRGQGIEPGMTLIVDTVTKPS
jgi:HlyD family secretion protein